jgi:hypothetical protein
MEGISTYDSTKESLAGIIKEIDKGKIQLPEFQRDWIWDDDHVGMIQGTVLRIIPCSNFIGV